MPEKLASIPIVVLLVALTGLPVVVRAEDPRPESSGAPSLVDDELSKSLGDDPLAEPSESKSAKPAEPPQDKTKSVGDPLDDELLKGLENSDTEEAVADEQNPLVKLNRRMREVEKRIAETKSDRQTQELQQQIVRDLDLLIERCQEQQSKSSGSKSSQQQQTAQRDAAKQPGQKPGQANSRASKQAAKDSSKEINPTKTERAELAEMEKLIKDGVWGQLPAHLREQMLQSSVDQFLPKYQVLIEEYFKTIAAGASKP